MRDVLTDDGRAMLMRCIDPAQAANPRIYDFRHNISNKAFPADFLAVGKRRETAIAADPKFRAPGKGDFRLGADSPAIGKGCVVEWGNRRRGTLRCRPPEPGAPAPDLGAFDRDGRLYAGPK